MSYTKGEWGYRPTVTGSGFYIETEDKSHKDSFIGEVGGGLQSESMIEANAKLIAAAPTLLTACKMLIKDSKFMRDEYSDINDAVKFAESAIKKATE